MNSTSTKEAIDPQITEQVKVLLYLLQEALEKAKDEVDNSYDLLTKIGEKTPLSRSIEKSIADPLSYLNYSVGSFNKIVKEAVEKLIVDFLRIQKGHLKSVHKADDRNTHLNYFIALKKDNEEERNNIFHFLDVYDKIELSDKYPVIFHFVPENLDLSSEKLKEVVL